MYFWTDTNQKKHTVHLSYLFLYKYVSMCVPWE